MPHAEQSETHMPQIPHVERHFTGSATVRERSREASTLHNSLQLTCLAGEKGRAPCRRHCPSMQEALPTSVGRLSSPLCGGDARYCSRLWY